MSWEETYKETKPAEEKSFSPIPTGKYLAQITNCALNESDDPSRVEWEFTILGGDYEHRKVWQNQRLDATGIPYIKQNFTLLGLPSDSPKELKESLAQAIGIGVELYVKQKPNPK